MFPINIKATNKEIMFVVHTWDSAIVNTIGNIIGCITTLRNSAQRGGRTWEHHNGKVHQIRKDGMDGYSNKTANCKQIYVGYLRFLIMIIIAKRD